MKRAWLLFLLFISISSFAQVDYWPYYKFGTEQGLPDQFIYSIVQDKEGKIWIGTGSGLYEFDGTRFRLHKPNDGNRESENLSMRLFYEKDNIWVTGIKSFSCFNLLSGKWQSKGKFDSLMTSIAKSHITCFFRDRNGILWIGTGTGDFGWVDENNFTFISYRKNKASDISSNYVNTIFEDNQGSLWAVGNKNLFRFSRNDTIVESVFRLNNEFSFSMGAYDNTDNLIWLSCSGQGLIRYELKSKTWKKYTLTSLENRKTREITFVNYVSLKSSSEVWVGSEGLCIFNKKTESFQMTSPNFKDEFSFRTGKITQIFHDKEGNDWISSFNGLCLLSWQNRNWKTTPVLSSDNSTWVESTKAIDIPGTPNYILITSNSQGIYFGNADSGTLKIITPKGWQKYRVDDASVTSSGEIYLISNGLLFKWNRNSNEIIRCSHQIFPIRNKFMESIQTGPDNSILLSGKFHEMILFNVKSEKFKVIPIPDTTHEVRPDFIDSKGRIWCTGTNYFGYYDMQQLKWKQWNEFSKDSNFPQGMVSGIAESLNGTIWISTRTSGIYSFAMNNDSVEIKNYCSINTLGFPNDYCSGIAISKNNDIWIGTLSGLVIFDTKTKTVTSTISRQNGLAYKHASTDLTITSGGNLIVPYYGIVCIYPIWKYKPEDKTGALIFTSIKNSGKNLLSQIKNSEKNIFPYSENDLSFDFSLLKYNNFNQASLFYILEGVNTEWILVGQDRHMEFNGLAPGNYVFRVKAKTHDGVMQTDELSFAFEILNPFYLTIPFFLMVSLLITTGGIFFIRYRVSLARKELQVKTNFEKEISKMEMAALRAQMNPHFIFNALNSINRYILKNDSEAASEYLAKFSKLIRMILDFSRENSILLEDELTLIKLYIEIEQLRFQGKFVIDYQVDPTLNPKAIKIPSMIIQPFVENAIWHGLQNKTELGKLMIQISPLSNGGVLIVIEDNGIGRNMDSRNASNDKLMKKSHGIKITSDRLRLLQFKGFHSEFNIIDLYTKEGKACGTRVVINLFNEQDKIITQ